MAGKYDAILDAEQGSAPATGPSPYDSVLDQEIAQQQQAARTVYEKALAVNPDQAASSKKLMNTTGLPLAVVERNLDEVKRKEQARMLDLARMAEDSPVLARQLVDPSFTNQAHDDVSTLGEIEQFIRDTGGSMKAGVFNASKGSAGVFRAGLEFVAPVLDPLESVTSIGGNPLRRLAEGFAMVGDAAGATAKAATPKTDGILSGGFQSGIQSLTQNLLALPMAFVPGGQAAALTFMTANTGGQSYQDARAKGLSMTQALPFAASQAAIEYATEKMPLEQLIGGIKASAPFLQTIAKQMALEIPGEQVATILQDLNEWAVLNPEKSFKSYLEERPNAAAQTLVATIVGTGGNVVIAKGIETATKKLMGDAYDAGVADLGAQNLQNALALATESKLRERNPEEFRALVQKIADNTDGAPTEVYIDAEVLNQLAPEVLAQLPGVAAQMQAALAANDVVSIPMADVLTIAPGTPLEQLVVENARIGDPRSMSQAEAKVAGEKAQEFLTQEAQRVIAQAQDQQAMQESSDRVKQSMLDQLNTVGRFRKDVNEAYATWTAAFYTTMAGRLGITPEEMQAKYPLRVVGQAGQGAVLNAGGKPGEMTVEGYHFSPVDRSVLTTEAYGTGLKGSARDEILNHPDQRLRQRLSFYFDKGTGIRPESGVGGRAHRVQLTGVYDSDADPLKLRSGDARAFEAKLLDAGYSGYLTRMDGTQPGQVIMLGKQQFTPERLGAVSRIDNGQRIAPLPAVEAQWQTQASGEPAMLQMKLERMQGMPAWADYDIRIEGRELQVRKKDDGTYQQSLSSRLPSAVKATEDPLSNVLNISYDTVLSDTKTLEKNVAALQGLPNVRKLKGKGAKDPVKNAEAFIDHVVNNLLWLHDHMPKDMRERAHLWYDGGRKTIETWAKRYGISEMQGAAAIAVLSPQNGWFANVSQAERIADMVFGLRDFVWDDAMTAEATRISSEDGLDPRMLAAQGKTLGELLATPDIAARWARVYDQTYNNRAYRVLTPEGGAADYVKTGKGADATMMWKSYSTIAKAISVLMDGRAENVHYQIGKEHKVRNFYNNLFDPMSPLGFATIDTHAVAAALLRPLASADIEVAQAFGGGGSSSSAVTGLNGTYPIYLEAYRRAAEARGILPREMQSITWEAVRGLFEAAKKSGLKKPANEIWARYKAGEIDQQQAQKEILALAGDITPPSWTSVPFNDTPTRTYEGPAQKAIDERGDIGAAETPSAKIMFEVAPDPNDAALTAEWNALSSNERLRISQDVAAKVVPKVLKELGTEGDFVMQLGGYMGATNPSMTLRLARPELSLTAAKLLGHALAQDSMMVVTEDRVVGSEEVGAVTIQLPEGYGETEVAALYDRLWELEHGGEKLVGGHTTADGQMVILNYSALSTEQLGQMIDTHLGGEFVVAGDTVYSAFPNKEDYGYGVQNEPEGNTASRQSPAQRRPDNLRAEATQLLREALDARRADDTASGTYAQSGQVTYEVQRDEDNEGTFVFAKDTTRLDATGQPLTVGHLHVPDEAVDADGNFQIGDVNVDSTMRRQGIATAMTQRMEQELGGKATGATSVFSPDGKAFFDAYANPGTYAQESVSQPGPLLAPNGKPSNLSPELYRIVRTPEFKAWFGDWESALADGGVWAHDDVSKAVDENGEPLVLYHGTDKGGFTEFNTPGGTKRGDLGIFTTPNREMARSYVKRGRGQELTRDQVMAANEDGDAVSGVYPVFANIRNPNESDFEGANWSGERNGQYIVAVDGEQQFTPEGNGYFNLFDDANTFASQNGGEVEPAPDHYETTDSVVREARKYNDGAIIRNVTDDGGGRSGYGGEPSDVFVALDPTQIKSVENFGTFNPNDPNIYKQGPRGTFNPKSLELALNENADLSTFLHETGHFFLEVMADLAAQPGAPADIAADMTALLKWFGVSDLDTWNQMSLDQKRKYHERFAESFEQYLLEGKAPSLELQPLFRKFRAWMLNVYKSVKAFIEGHPESDIQLSDEVRQVFDRMLASEEQVAQAEQVAGLLPEYDATNEAIEKLTARSLRDLKWTVNARAKAIKALQKQAATLRKEVQAEVTAEVNQLPEFQAKDMLDKTRKENKQQLNDTELAIVADSFGYPDTDTMLQAIDAIGKKADLIEGMTDQRMLERHGDLIDQRAIEQAANEAVHNEARARSLATELRSQAEALNPRVDTGQTNAKGSKITVNAIVEAAKQFAANVVASTPLRDLKAKAWQHTAAERRAGKRWQEHTAKGETQEAVKAKQDQVLNNAAAKAAMDAQVEMRKILEFFKRVIKDNNEKVVDKGRDPDVVNAARAVLAAYGVAPKAGKTALEYMDLVAKNDPAMYAALQPSVQGALNMAQPLDALTMEELRGLHEEIQAMWHLAKRSRQMEVDGNLLDMQDAEDELQARMQEVGVPDSMPGESGAMTTREELARKLQFAGSLLRRVEQWAEGLDGKFGGPFLKLVFQPVKDAADRYRADRVKFRKKYQALVDNVAPALTKGLIEAPELGYTFGKGHNGIGHAELLHAILHTGNESNKRKLLLGRGWATENQDGTLDTSRWDAFLKRMHDTGILTKAHYDFAQGVWDLLEETKPLAQKTHRDVFGRYFAEVTADSFETPFGSYRGGYVPAQADPRIVQDADLRKLAEAENENMAFSFPGTNKGFTKGRVEYNRPLMLDLRTIGQHIDKVLLFSHMEPAVRDVQKLLSRKGVSYSLGRIDPTAYAGMLTPWLNRSARQVVETPIVGDGGISRVLSAARNRAGMSLMFANVSNTIQQLTGFSLAAVKVKPSSMMAATAQFISSPKKMAKTVADASDFMANRMENEIAAINDAMDQILLDPNVYEKAQAWTQKHAYFLQTAMANTMEPIIWTGAYNDALAEGQSEKDAVRYADNVIRTTQGSTLPEDVSRIETGPAYARIFTQFIGYFNMMANTNATALKQISQEMGLKKGAGKALGVVAMGMLIPLWIAEAIAQAMRGGPEDEDDDGYLDDWLAAVFGMGTIKGSLAMVPFVGQLANAAINRFNGNPADDKMSLSPAVSILESAVGVPVDVYKAITDPDKLNKRNAVRDVASLVSIATGLPAVAVARPVGYLAGVADDRIDPTSNVDLARGLVTGSASPESK